MVSAKQLMQYESQAWAIIREHGWMVQGVGAFASYPQFCYTVGFNEFQHPEVIVFALSFEVAKTLLNDLGKQVRAGRRFQAGEEIDDLLAGDYKVMLIKVVDSSLLTFANRLYRRGSQQVEALQLVVPDQDHRWPWDPESRLTYPLLGAAP